MELIAIFGRKKEGELLNGHETIGIFSVAGLEFSISPKPGEFFPSIFFRPKESGYPER
ncbi:MAG: hypothetical protein LBG65_04515 [Puniceicoccales bacterium]|nr:hypothetical protein [Puniceicoccales bacterium]